MESHGRFDTARARVILTLFDFLVTNVRLGAYNGLHLVYLCSPGPGAPRAIVYSDKRDPGLAREAQRAGAFYEVGLCLPVTSRGRCLFAIGAIPRSPIGGVCFAAAAGAGITIW